MVGPNEETDIYCDLPSFKYDEILDKLQTTNKKLIARVLELEEIVATITKQNDKYRKHCENLSKNISSLFKTAQMEVRKKDNMIRELNQKLICFRVEKYRYQKKRFLGAASQDDSTNISPAKKKARLEQTTGNCRDKAIGHRKSVDSQVNSENNVLVEGLAKDKVSDIEEKPSVNRPNKPAIPNIKCHTLYSRRMFNKIYNINQPEEQKSCVSEVQKSSVPQEGMKEATEVTEEVITEKTEEISSISEKTSLKKGSSSEIVEKGDSSETVSQRSFPTFQKENIPIKEKCISNDETACCMKPMSLFCEPGNAMANLIDLSTSNSRVVENIDTGNLMKSIFDNSEDVDTNCGYVMRATLEKTTFIDSEPLAPPINQKIVNTDIQENIDRNENSHIVNCDLKNDFRLSLKHPEVFNLEINNARRVPLSPDGLSMAPSKQDLISMEGTLQKKKFLSKDLKEVPLEGSFQQEPKKLVSEEMSVQKEQFPSLSEEMNSRKKQFSSKEVGSDERRLRKEPFSSKDLLPVERHLQKEQFSSDVISESFPNLAIIQQKNDANIQMTAGEVKVDKNCDFTNELRSNREMINAKTVISKSEGSCESKTPLEKGNGLKEGGYRKEQFLSSVISKLHKKSCKGATISPISSQWNLSKEKYIEPRIKCETSVEVKRSAENEKSSTKADIMESLFGSPVKWTDNSADDSQSAVKMIPPLAAYEDSCSAQIENTRFKSNQENIDGVTKLSVVLKKAEVQLTEKNSVPLDNNIPNVESHSVNKDNIYSKNIDFDKSNESHLSFKENNCKLMKFASFISHESSEACDVPSLSSKVNYSEHITSRLFSTKSAKYHDSILGQFDDTTQLISALAKSHCKLSPINTPVKDTIVSPVRKINTIAADTTVSPVSKATPIKDIAVSPIRKIFTPVKDAAVSSIKREERRVSPLKISLTKGKNEKKTIFLEQPVNILCPRKTPRVISRNSKQKQTSPQTKERTRDSLLPGENARESPQAKENAPVSTQAKENAPVSTQAKENAPESIQAKDETRELTQALPQAKEKPRDEFCLKKQKFEPQPKVKSREYSSSNKVYRESSAAELKKKDKLLLNVEKYEKREKTELRKRTNTFIRTESTPEKINLVKLLSKSPVDKLNHVDMNNKYVKRPKLEPEYNQNNFTEKMNIFSPNDISRLKKSREDWMANREIERSCGYRSPSRKENSPRITESSRFPSYMKNLVFKRPISSKTSYLRPNCNYRHSSVERKIIKDRRHSLVRATPIREVPKYTRSKESKHRSFSSSSRKFEGSTKPNVEVTSNILSNVPKPRLIVRSSRAEWGATTSDVISTKSDVSTKSNEHSVCQTQVIGNCLAGKKLSSTSTKTEVISIKSDENVSTCQTQLIRNSPDVKKSPSCENSMKWVLTPIDFDPKERSTSVKHIPTIRSPSPFEDSGVKKSTPSPAKIQTPVSNRSSESLKSRYTPTPEQSPTGKSPGIVIVSRRRPARFGVSEISDKSSFRFSEDRN